MQKCYWCPAVFDSKTAAKLSNHVRKEHGQSFENYIIQSQYNGVAPKCACGLCEERPFFHRGKFSEYALGHEKFEIREKLYIEKYGEPKCAHCGSAVDFYRGEPRQFCSHTCAGLHNGGFTQEETQAKIKEVVIEKYGVDNVSKLDSVKEKISEQNTGNGGWKHTSETLKRMSNASKLMWKNPRYKSNMRIMLSALRKRNWQDPVYRKTILQGNLSGKHSKLHQKIAEYFGLKKLGFESERVVFRYRVDEVNFDKKIVVEINGDYIHANPNKFKSDDLIIVRKSQYLAQDKWNYNQKRKEALEALGFIVFVVWQSDDLDKKKLELYQLLGIG